MEENKKEKTHVRYVVNYNDRTYEHPLHSNKLYFIKNIADVVNILEYCVTQDLKNALYKADEKMYDFNVERLVDDKIDERFDKDWFKGATSSMIKQMIDDTIQRNS